MNGVNCDVLTCASLKHHGAGDGETYFLIRQKNGPIAGCIFGLISAFLISGVVPSWKEVSSDPSPWPAKLLFMTGYLAALFLVSAISFWSFFGEERLTSFAGKFIIDHRIFGLRFRNIATIEKSRIDRISIDEVPIRRHGRIAGIRRLILFSCSDKAEIRTRVSMAECTAYELLEFLQQEVSKVV